MAEQGMVREEKGNAPKAPRDASISSPREAPISSIHAVMAEHIAGHNPDRILGRLRVENNGIDAETRERDRESARGSIGKILGLVAQEDRPTALGMLEDIVERMLAKGISKRAISNVRLDRIAQNLEKKGGGIGILEKMHDFYASGAFDDAIKGMGEWPDINIMISTMGGDAQKIRAAILSQSATGYEHFKQLLESDASGDGEMDRSIRHMKADEVLGVIFLSRSMAELMRGSLFGTPLRINIAFFSTRELAYLASVAAAPYAAEVPPNEIRITAARSNAVSLVLSLAEKMAAGSRIEIPRLLVYLAEKLPEASRADVPRLVSDALEVLMSQKRPPEQNEAEWLKRMQQYFGQFQEDENEPALASLRYIAKNPTSIFESD